MSSYLDSLLADAPSASASASATAEARAPRRRLVESPIVSPLPGEIRDAHLKAAVFPSEKEPLERMVRVVHGCTMSDFLRDYLIREFLAAKQRGVI